jgi:hypothetical protein
LRKQIQDREKNGQAFNNAELTHLFYQQNSAQAFLQSHGLAHGDVQPLYIGYDPEKQESKLIDRSDTANTDLSIIQGQKNRLISGQPLYQSPTMYSNLKKGNLKFQFDKNKEDCFALGLAILEAGNGRSIQNIYEAKPGNINQAALQQHIDDFNRKFQNENHILTSNVTAMTNLNENDRPNPVTVQASLPPYDQVSAFLAQGGDMNTMNTHVINYGGENKTIITNIKEQAPEINYDLFSDYTDSNPYLVQSSHYEVDSSNDNQGPQYITVPQTQYIVKSNQSATQDMTQPHSEVNAQSVYVNTNQWDNTNKQDFSKQEHPKTIVYAETTDDWQQDFGHQGGQTSHYVHAEAPVPEIQSNRQVSISKPTGDAHQTSFSQANVSTYSEPHVSSYNPNQSVVHEFRLHDSRIVQPEVISNHSFISDSSHSVPVSSNYVYAQPTNIVYHNEPVATNYQPSYRPSMSTIYTQAPAQTVTYTEAQKQTTYQQGSNRNVSYSQNPSQNLIYTQVPVQTVVQETSAYKTSYVPQAPMQSYTNIANYQPQGSRSTFDTTGLKLVGSYTDAKFATEKGNY